YSLFWTCDDAFISFRYSDNLIEGKGLRYNAVEKVEGYSNFLWTILIALARYLTDADAAVLGNWLGLMFGCGTLLLLVRATRKLGGSGALPIAAVGLACHYHFAVFASCGLETSMAAFLTTALVCNLIEAKTPRCYVIAGLIGTMIAMTRADGPLIYGLAGLFVLFTSLRARNPRLFVGILMPGVLLWIPYFVCRWIYYGDPMANVFYAKSVSQAYPSQGWIYVRMFFECYWILIPALLGILYLALRQGPQRRAGLAIAAIVVPFVVFVTYIGGDFMFARYLIPITPALYLGLEITCRLMGGPRIQAGAWLVVGCGSLLMLYPTGKIDQHLSPLGIGEERLFYPPTRTETFRVFGKELRRLTEGTNASMAIAGGQAAIAYYSRFPLVIECASGLTDRWIARQPLKKRGKVGHERLTPTVYLFQRSINLALFRPHEIGFKHPLDATLRSMKAGKEEVTIITWSDEVMATIRARSDGVIKFLDVHSYLDRYLAEAKNKPKKELRSDLQYFRDFYFDHNKDPDRLSRFEALAK
ncbi:MAG: hypothetical protein VX951_08250, partial [Planctomycetota bacterium]|nr:hypothetical protein [Planctomycetota bacterium]